MKVEVNKIIHLKRVGDQSMSISNRKIKQGTLPVTYESKLQRLIAKLYCLVVGHKKVNVITDKVNKTYCVCCWKEID